MTQDEIHDVRYDRAGFAQLPRLTCFSCQETCLRQPWMSDCIWDEKLKIFTEKHPHQRADLAEPAGA